MAGLGCRLTVLAVRLPAANGAGMAYFEGAPIDFRFFGPPAPRPLLERKLRSLWRSGWELAQSDFGRAARAEVGRNYDAILAEMPETARAVEDDSRTLLSLHHFRFMDLARAGDDNRDDRRRERVQARRAELSTARRVGRIRATSSRLERFCREHGVRAPIDVVPICVDPALYEPVSPPAVPTVGVLGSMFWAPSRNAARHFVERLAPRIRAAVPGVRFVVGGWQAQRFVGPFVRDADVEILDSFPDPRAAFARLSVLLYAPPVGTGMKVKVLEAMAFGVPCVVNSEGFEGLDADPDPAVRLGDTDDDLVAHTVELLRDPAMHRRTAEAGRACIERSFSPGVVAGKMVEVLGKVGLGG
ncbi:glycosyltransferase [Candidatus Binatia bacterium]|nr:glycosyltransferase [Candidatus Binatia bacterium]